MDSMTQNVQLTNRMFSMCSMSIFHTYLEQERARLEDDGDGRCCLLFSEDNIFRPRRLLCARAA